MAQKKEKELSSQDEEQLIKTVEELKRIAETATFCDHGTIGDRWSFGILMEACKMKSNAWVVCNHKINRRSISVQEADKLNVIETMYPNTG
jgi:hypothetical protein